MDGDKNPSSALRFQTSFIPGRRTHNARTTIKNERQKSSRANVATDLHFGRMIWSTDLIYGGKKDKGGLTFSFISTAGSLGGFNSRLSRFKDPFPNEREGGRQRSARMWTRCAVFISAQLITLISICMHHHTTSGRLNAEWKHPVLLQRIRLNNDELIQSLILVCIWPQRVEFSLGFDSCRI